VKEVDMQAFPVGAGCGKRYALILLLALGVSGCKQEKLPKKVESFPCDDQKVNVNLDDGAEPRAVYICEDNSVTWNANGLKFLVEFKGDSPFKGEEKKFDNKSPRSAGGKRVHGLTVYEYRITVDGHVFDPQVIGGGTP
jgi:hypothetical protein